ncbi:hypothetical protein PtB15_13B169 [Puccinia triticina]|nr:hypothetical protein PtB15_13B169 [Puccinia triticina]
MAKRLYQLASQVRAASSGAAQPLDEAPTVAGNGYKSFNRPSDEGENPGYKNQRGSGYKGKNFNPKHEEQKAAAGNGSNIGIRKGQDSNP